VRSISTPKAFFFAAMIWLALLGCQITNELTQLTQAKAVPTSTRTRTPTTLITHPTFTPIPPTLEIPPTVAQPIIPPTNPPPPPPSPTRTTAPRPAPTRAPVIAPPSPPTPDLFQGYFYRVLKNNCVSADNTRIEGTVFNNGVPQSGVRVRLSSGKYDVPVIDDFITGTDPADAKHIAPEWAGRYRLSPAEGQRMDGNWWVFIIDNKETPLSVAAYIKTHDAPGCNTATVDFAH
jgi:hypothetical protein